MPIGPDSLEHASLRPPNLTFEHRFNFNSDQVQNDLQDVIKSVQLHDQRHRPTCRKKGTTCRFGFPFRGRENAIIKHVKYRGEKNPD